MVELVLRQSKGLVYFLQLNADRIYTLGTVVVGLMAGAFLGTALLNP
jgi:hypothetical protein